MSVARLPPVELPALDLPPNVQLEDRDCPMGCPRNDDVVLTGFDRLHDVSGRFTVVRCSTCSLMRTNPRPTPESIGTYYPSDYGPYAGTLIRPDTPLQPRSWRRRVIDALRDTRSNAIPSLPPGRMLEIGSASGSFLNAMQQRGWDVKGIEFSPQAAEAARKEGLDVFCGRLEDAPEPSDLFDLITAWMAFEHLHEPADSMRRLRRWVRPAGWLAFSVPNAGSLEFRLLKDAWYALQLPTHLYHFTPHTIRRLLEQSGWRVERIVHQRSLSNLVASVGYRLRERSPQSRLAAALVRYPDQDTRLNDLTLPLSTLAALAGQTGRMTVWARPA